jgi:glycerol-3-phosphate dehydrogenase
MKRQVMLQRISDFRQAWDLVIIGGGATGLGIAWNASACGYRSLLLESNDFAHGTSSRSTKLIHGGVRYLRQGQIAMVRSALHEREQLLRTAQPFVWPLEMVIPSYRLGSRWYYYAGLKLYDFLAGKRNMQPARLVSSQSISSLLPTIKSNGLRGGVAFSDGQFDDARLALAVAQSIAADGRSAALNYAPVQSIDTHRDSGTRVVRFRDLIGQQEMEVQAKVVINATGVFAEQVSRLEKQPTNIDHPIRIAPSRGTHLVLPGTFLPGKHALMIPHTDDGRVLFLIPWLGYTLLGTTDIATNSIDLEPRATDEEVDYLLSHAARYLTVAPQRKDVLSVFSGLRPLLGKTGNRSTSQLSREHEIMVSPNGLISIIGGKWTTFRKMGLDVLKLAIELGGLRPLVYQTPQLHQESSHARTVHSDELLRLDPELPVCRADVRRAVQSEMAEQLEDVLARRTRCLLLNAAATKAVAPTVAEWMSQENGRGPEWVQNQVTSFSQLADGYRLRAQAIS